MENDFIKHNHYQLIELEDGKKAIGEAELTEASLNPYGYAHGGFIFGLGDTAMGLVALSTGRNAVTLNGTINYLKPTIGKKLKVVAEMMKNGKKTCYLRCSFYDDNANLTATMDGNYYYIDEEERK